MAKAYLVGSGIAALAAAAFLIRDGGFDGTDIHLFEEQMGIGGGLDAGGTAEAGYTMRGGRMFEAEFRCTRRRRGPAGAAKPRAAGRRSSRATGRSKPGSGGARALLGSADRWALRSNCLVVSVPSHKQ